MVARWYRAVGAHFADQRAFADALRHFDSARALAITDADVLYGEACLQETLAAPRLQDYVRTTTLPDGLQILGVSSPETHYRRAEDLLRRALDAHPDFPEANLRLGRVLSQQRRHKDALPYLRRVTGSLDDVLIYYARLFEGDVLFALGDTHAAQRAFEEAAGRFPGAQAAQLGLALAHRTLGNRTAAAEAVAAIDVLDPWWTYYYGDGAQVERLLDDLRAPLRRPQ
jgi:tetratricopeptide (TPR) repeat protein